MAENQRLKSKTGTEDNGAIQETVPEIKRGRGTIRL
jgi:hypothetical protein